MLDPTLAPRLAAHADQLDQQSRCLRAETAASPWMSTAAEAMRGRADAVCAGLATAERQVRDAASALVRAQDAAVARVESLLAEAARAEQQAVQAMQRAEGVVVAGVTDAGDRVRAQADQVAAAARAHADSVRDQATSLAGVLHGLHR